ncbi:hypothetical protein FJY90_00825 [Candidatus Gottesmanbacteria bacterium]|nr:hypothetical protein [Candidatus Gottesmanbacteria bacterium]MBM4305358.1 hypothetical protein [Deltaproteobacteria bacterium]
MDNLEIALSYLKKGIAVMPLWSPEMVKINPREAFVQKVNEKQKENAKSDHPFPEEEIFKKLLIDECKTPLLFNWKEYQERFPTIEEVTRWFTENPLANIAIITGKVSNLVVFDLDSKEAEVYADQKGGFPNTVRARTGKGYHVYVKHPGIDTHNRMNRALKIDIKANGGYVVAPPSFHGSGAQYKWEEGLSIFDLEFAECTPWMLDHLKGITDISTEGKKDKKREANHESERKPPCNKEFQDTWVKILRTGCKEGERNDTAARLIGHLFQKGLNEGEVWEWVTMWNEKNKPPIAANELKRTFESIKRNESEGKVQRMDIESFLDTGDMVIKEYDQNYVRVPFGEANLTALERKMNGGLIGGRLYILGGIPTSGKTGLVNSIADNICMNGAPVLFFSYDDGRTELRYRTLARLCKVPIESFNLRSQLNIKDLCIDPQIRKIMGLKYVVEAMMPVEEWDGPIEEIKRKHGRPPVLIIDYLRKLRTKRKSQDERLRIEEIVGQLTSLAKTWNIPIVAISELARDSYKSGQKLSMASFKETGMIEYEASWLGILALVEEVEGGYRVKEDWEDIIRYDGNIDLIIFKAKRGTGSTGKVPLKVDKEYMVVTDRLANKTNKKTTSIFGQEKS